MNINQAGLYLPAQRMTTQHRINRRERIIKGTLHKHLSQNLRDQNFAPARITENTRSASRRVLGKI